MKDIALTLFGICLIAGALIFSFVTVGIDLGITHMRDAAVEHGAGKWTVEEKTGRKRFEWVKGAPPP
jgi:hypothetical protein